MDTHRRTHNMHTHTHTDPHKCTRPHTQRHSCMRTPTHRHMHAHTHTGKHTGTNTRTCTNTHRRTQAQRAGGCLPGRGAGDQLLLLGCWKGHGRLWTAVSEMTRMKISTSKSVLGVSIWEGTPRKAWDKLEIVSINWPWWSFYPWDLDFNKRAKEKDENASRLLCLVLPL